MSKTAKALGLAIVAVLAVGIGIVDLSEASPLRRDLKIVKFIANHGGSNMPERMANKVMKQLELSDPQRARVQTTADTFLPQLEALADELQVNGFRLMDVAPADPRYDDVVADVSRTSADLTGRMIEVGSRMRAELYAVLTPAQRREAALMRAELKQELLELIEAID